MTKEPEIDWAECQTQTGVSDLQLRFVQGLVNGLNKTRAAEQAGYSGEGSTLRSGAAQAAKSHKVRAAIAWAQSQGAGPSDVPGDETELKKILWRHARSSDPGRSIKGAEALNKLSERERAFAMPSDDGFGDWRMARDLIVTRGADGALIAAALHWAALESLPMLHDVAPLVMKEWPEYWNKRFDRHSSMMRQATLKVLADPEYQREAREKIWREIDYEIGADNVAASKTEAVANGTPMSGGPAEPVAEQQGGACTA